MGKNSSYNKDKLGSIQKKKKNEGVGSQYLRLH